MYDKSGLSILSSAFAKHEVSIIGSGGTAEAIRKLGHQVTDVSDYTGYSEMPGGLVKTLHPKIHAGILGDWNDPSQRKYLETNSIRPFDFVVVNLYPFQEVVKQDPENHQKAVDNIDIGGVALIRAAAKGALLNQRVVPVTNPFHYDGLIRELDRYGKIGPEMRLSLAKEAFGITARYDLAISEYFSRNTK